MMARSAKKVLNDTTNKKKTKKTELKKLDESQWRNHMLAFYKSELSQLKYLEANTIKRDPFRYRWEGSRLRELKKAKANLAYAEKQYDRWFCQWKGKQQRNGSGFEIHIDDDEEEGDASAVTDGNGQEIVETIVVDLNVIDTDEDEENTDFLNIPLQVEEELKKPRISKLEGDNIKQLLIEYYLCTEKTKLLTFIRQKKLFNNKNAIVRHWKDGRLEHNKIDNQHVTKAIKDYDDWCASEREKKSKINTLNASNTKALPVALEIFMRELIKQLALCGQGLGKKAVKHILTEALKDGSDDGSFSRSTLDRFTINYKLECKNVKNIDPARISQVTAENRDAFFFRLDQTVKLVHSIDPVNCKANTWNEVLPECIYNMDEMGTDPTKFRDVLLIPEEILNRIFQATPEGDRAAVHLSLAIFSCSNGKYKDESANIEGAPMPFMIHSSPENQDGMSAIERRLSLYDEQDTIPFDEDRFTQGFIRENKSLGITIRSSANGSMTKVLFLDAVLHFIKNIPSDQGADGKYTFLLLDSHVSRWNPKALYHLFKNRIIPIFFPSHLSIVVQPQDNGVILFFHKCLEEASLLERLFRSET